MSWVDRNLGSVGSTITWMNSSRFLVTAKIETPKEVRMSTDLGICSFSKFYVLIVIVCLGFIHSIATYRTSVHFFALLLPMTTFGKIGQRQHFNNQRIEEKRPRPGRYWNPCRLVSWKIWNEHNWVKITNTFETYYQRWLTWQNWTPWRFATSPQPFPAVFFIEPAYPEYNSQYGTVRRSTDLRKSALQPSD